MTVVTDWSEVMAGHIERVQPPPDLVPLATNVCKAIVAVCGLSGPPKEFLLSELGKTLQYINTPAFLVDKP